MSQIRRHYSDSNTNFDLIEKKGFGLVRSIIHGLLHDLLVLQEQIKPQTHMARDFPLCNKTHHAFSECLMSLTQEFHELLVMLKREKKHKLTISQQWV